MDINPFINRPDEWSLYEPLIGDSMLELGGKQNPDLIRGKHLTYKAYFKSLGFRHVSIDWNGMWGALKLDLRRPLVKHLGTFDMLSNMGTTEHVSDQAGVWRNIHELTMVGGVYVGQTPYPDGKSWWWHGEHYPTEDFYKSFAELNNWDIIRLYKGREIPNENLYCRMQKKANPEFRMPDTSLIKFNVRRGRHK
jgi:hypothetical protein